MSEKKENNGLSAKLNEYEEKLAEVNSLLASNKEKEIAIATELSELIKETERLEKRKSKTLNGMDKLLAILTVVVSIPPLFLALYAYLKFFGLRFMNTAWGIVKHMYGFATLFGGGMILFGGPKIIREFSNWMTKTCTNHLLNTPKYKALEQTITSQKERIASLHLEKKTTIAQRTDLLFECSKYNASLQLGAWHLKQPIEQAKPDYSQEHAEEVAKYPKRVRTK